MEHQLFTSTDYDPGRLLDALIRRLDLKNDAGLARALEVAPPLVSKMRNHRALVSDALLIRMHEISALSIRELKTLMGNRPVTLDELGVSAYLH